VGTPGQDAKRVREDWRQSASRQPWEGGFESGHGGGQRKVEPKGLVQFVGNGFAPMLECESLFQIVEKTSGVPG